MNLFLWGALPYIAFTFLIAGTLIRFFYFESNWTTKSSEFLEKKQLRIANPLFHFGLACVLGGNSPAIHHLTFNAQLRGDFCR